MNTNLFNVYNMKKTIFTLIVLASILLWGKATGASVAEWTDDFEAAKNLATSEGKDLLLHFTGSDWCPWCIKLHKEVLSQELFKKESPKHFVLVEVDFPRKKKQPEKVREQNQELETVYQVEGFPTIILTDSQGRPYARTGYREGGPDNFLHHLNELLSIKLKRDALFKEAASAQGAEKAKLLDQALNYLQSSGIENLNEYIDIIDNIIENDRDNALGLKAGYEILKVRYKSTKRIFDIMSTLNRNLSREHDSALKELVALAEVSRPVPEIVQIIYLKMAELYREGKKDEIAWFENLVKAAEVAPYTDTGKQIFELIKEIKEER